VSAYIISCMLTGGIGGEPPVASLLAMPRSLLVFQNEAYTHCLHGIEEVRNHTISFSSSFTPWLPFSMQAGGCCAAGRWERSRWEGKGEGIPTTCVCSPTPGDHGQNQLLCIASDIWVLRAAAVSNSSYV
jgi:hypothetical protein